MERSMHEKLKKLSKVIAFEQNFLCILVLTCYLAFGCGSAATKKAPSIEGYLYKARLTRLTTESAWTEVSGEMRFYLFGAGIFRQEALLYIEPQLYGPSEACSGVANGVFLIGYDKALESNESDGALPKGEDAIEGENMIPTKKVGQTYVDHLFFKYDPGTTFKGLCTMHDRSILVYRQPSGALDMVDDKKVIRFDRVESLN